MAIYDCFTFFNELDLLEIRLSELCSVVDRFVIAESTRTFSGKDKPLLYYENRNRFREFASRIEHIVVDDVPKGNTEKHIWEREFHQRRSLMTGLKTANDDDLILLSDVDEIPRATSVLEASKTENKEPTVHCFELRMFVYFLNLEDPRGWLRNGPRMMLKKYIRDMQTLRNIRAPDGRVANDLLRWFKSSLSMGRPLRFKVHKNAGWHFTYLNGLDAISLKIQSYSHSISDEWKSREWIKERIERSLTLKPEDQTVLVKREIDHNFPISISDRLDNYRDLILTGSR